MPGSPSSILALHLTTRERARLDQAVRAACPDAVVTPLPTLDAALQHAGLPGAELLVIGADTPPEDRVRAAGATTPDGLPRWPVVVLTAGTPDAFIWYSPASRAGADGLGAVLSVAAVQHASQRAAARARGDFRTIARRVSHEMRSPLGSILTSVDVLREEFEDKPGVVEGLLHPIVDSVSDIMKLLDRLSLLARATATPVEVGPIGMGTVVWSARERCAQRIAAEGREVAEPEEWPTVSGVADWLAQVWEILIANALDHAGADAPRIELGWERRDGECRFHVRDGGPGVAPEIRRLLFRPFHLLYQMDSGRGTGLALVQRLVELQGGRCGYEPVQPRGSCFYFTLPAAPVPPSSPS